MLPQNVGQNCLEFSGQFCHASVERSSRGWAHMTRTVAVKTILQSEIDFDTSVTSYCG